MGLACHRHLALFHRLEQGRLHFCRRTVDLVGQHQGRKQRSGLEYEVALALAIVAIDLGAQQVGGQQVGGELDAREAQAQLTPQGLDGARLGQTGQAFEQQVAVGQQRDQQRLDHRGLADHGRAQARAQRGEGLQRAGAHWSPIRSEPPFWRGAHSRKEAIWAPTASATWPPKPTPIFIARSLLFWPSWRS